MQTSAVEFALQMDLTDSGIAPKTSFAFLPKSNVFVAGRSPAQMTKSRVRFTVLRQTVFSLCCAGQDFSPADLQQ